MRGDGNCLWGKLWKSGLGCSFAFGQAKEMMDHDFDVEQYLVCKPESLVLWREAGNDIGASY